MSRRKWFQMCIVTVVTAFLLVFAGTAAAQGNSGNAFARVQAVQERHTAALMAKPGVVGTAVGLNDHNQQAVVVLLENASVGGLPQSLEGVPVQRFVTGKIEALKAPGGANSPSLTPRSKWPRPVPIGVSTGNATAADGATGTIGCRVKDSSGNVYALSNNHVYALENTAALGSEVLQPGLVDSAYSAANVIGHLTTFIPVQFGSTTNNVVDAALAASTTALLGSATPSNGYGTPTSSPVAATVNMRVQKYGRTTGLTSGKVYALNATVNISYSSGVARFVKQIVITGGRFSAAGDSGSLIVTASTCNPVGLLFAGSNTTTIANPISDVLSNLSSALKSSLVIDATR